MAGYGLEPYGLTPYGGDDSLLDHQWALVTSDGAFALVFGTKSTGIQTISAPDLGQRNPRTVDRGMPREDGISFGPDYEDGTTVTFECNVLTDDWEAQSDLLDEFRGAWSQRVFRKDADAYAILKTRHAGRVRLCYGRPRRFAEADGDLTHEGYTTVVADFVNRDGKFYDDAVQVEEVPIAAPPAIGLTTPIIVTGTDPNTQAFQFDTLSEAEQPGGVIVEGVETWPWIEIHGPVTNPSIELGEVTIELDATIPEGMYVTLDPRPWSRKVRRSDGANLAGKLTWSTPPMSQWLLQPGSYQLVYRGSDVTGNSFARVQWRAAHHRP